MTTQRFLSRSINPLVDLLVALLCVRVSPAVMNFLAPHIGWQPYYGFNIISSSPFMVGVAVTAVPVVLRMLGFYRKNDLQRISTAVSQVCSFIIYYLCGMGIYLGFRSIGSGDVMNHMILVNMLLVPVGILMRFFVFRVYKMRLSNKQGKQLRHVVLGGLSREEIDKQWALQPSFWTNTFNVVGYVTPDNYNENELQELLERYHVGQLIIFGDMQACVAIQKACEQCQVQGIDLYLPTQQRSSMHLTVRVSELGDYQVCVISSTPEYSWSRFAKDVIDRILAVVMLICSSPLWLFAAIGIKLSDPKGPVFYRQMRSGMYGKPFAMWKFRSMYSDADDRLAEVKAQFGNEMGGGPIFKLTNDPRIFPFGKIIRKTSIDELPQLLNIIKGDMSIVGPRPLPTYETAEFPEISDRRRLSVKPGLTCYWQIEGRSDSSGFEDMREKDFKYIDNWSLWLDVKLFFRTIPAVLFGKGAK